MPEFLVPGVYVQEAVASVHPIAGVATSIAVFIEESVRRGLQWAVFEASGPALWAQIRADVGAFLHTLFLQGAFRGTRAGEACFVRCDDTINTQSDIDDGIVHLLMGFAALRPAGFTLIGISQPVSAAIP
jgi:phage tail sheath protein FI